VALGSALFILIPLQAGMKIDDLSRVLQGVTAGIGFLGAGAILKLRERNDIKGLTTAASVWLTAAIGVAAGMGRETTAVVSAVFAFVILSLLKRRETDKDNTKETA
jgi:putative Mg2+ transporter-C (MgtC) family protein